MKKLISVLLILALLTGLLPAVYAEGGEYENKTVLIYTGNIRGQIDLYPKIKALKDSYLAKGAEVVLVDTGNFLRGTAWANASMGADVYTLMDAVGYDAAVMGEAEFSYAAATTGYAYHGNFTRYYTQAMLQDGTDAVTYYKDRNNTVEATLPAREGAGFQMLCSNLHSLSDVYSFADEMFLTTPSGYQLHLQGYSDASITQKVPDGLLSSYVGLLPSEDEEPWVFRDIEFAIANDPNVFEADIGGLAYVSPESEATVGVYVLRHMTFSDFSGGYYAEDVDLSAFEPDPEIAALVQQIKDRTAANPDAAVLFTNQSVLEGRDSVSRCAETDLGDLVTDALRWYAETYIDGWNKDLPLVAVQNGGNLDDFLYPGEVTGVDLLKSLPFSPMGVGVIELTGAQLLEALEAGTQNLPCPGFAHVSGMQYTVREYVAFDAGEAYGKFYRADSVNRVEINEIGGQAFDPEATYAVVADNFLMNGNDTYYVFKEAKDAGAAYVNNGGGVKVRDIVSLYVNQILGGTVGPIEPEGRIMSIGLPFEDVTRDDYFYEPVRWAFENGITDGTTDTTFSPGDPCTRGQVVTFLWRSWAEPTPTQSSNPFGDIKPEDYFFRPVLWALERKITDGTSDTTFSPDAPCTRAQVVTFLWRSKGSPRMDDVWCPFTDVDPDAWYYDAVLWALRCGVTDGTSDTTFSPEDTCTRAQVVTFLYRANPPAPAEPK